MTPEELQRPFDTIESAHDFMNVLAETILEVNKDLERDRQRAIREGERRRQQAIELAIFKTKMLACHVHKSRRTLNDLRLIRRIMTDERATVASVLATL